jgi:hypothetical protein
LSAASGWNVSSRDFVGKLAEEGIAPGPQDHARAIAGHDICAHETQVGRSNGPSQFVSLASANYSAGMASPVRAD